MVLCRLWAGLVLVGMLVGVEGALGQARVSAPAVLAQSKVFPVDAMPLRLMANGGESRDSLKGALVSGEMVSVHESMQPAGMKTNPQHVIQHSEIITVLEGTVAFEHGDAAERVGPGGVIYVAEGTLHTLRNVGDGVARYVVVAIGVDGK
jgi:mannose-6-phosphate isomerase-like protein (cupin superfamily)